MESMNASIEHIGYKWRILISITFLQSIQMRRDLSFTGVNTIVSAHLLPASLKAHISYILSISAFTNWSAFGASLCRVRRRGQLFTGCNETRCSGTLMGPKCPSHMDWNSGRCLHELFETCLEGGVYLDTFILMIHSSLAAFTFLL